MPYFTLSFDLGMLDSEVAETACVASGAIGVTFSDARDDAVLEPAPGEIRLWPKTRVQALYEAHLASPQLIASLAGTLGLQSAQLETRSLADRAWEREWLRDFHALRFGRHLWICPHHEQVDADEAVVVRLDPGLAFGTGRHPSTALCLEWLDANAPIGQQLIDYGCGSGVLAIAAAKLGAARAFAFDIDPQALIATGQNAERNGVCAPLQLCYNRQQLPAGCDVLLANILAGTLCELAHSFAALVRPRGALLLAGLLSAQAEEVTACYAPWFDMRPAGEREGWIALAGIRHPCSRSAPSAP